MKRLIVVYFFFFHSFYFIYPNMTQYEPGYGGMLYPLNTTSLIMLEEEINIDAYLADQGPIVRSRGEDAIYYYQFDCKYVFQNNGDAETYLLGFPVSYGISSGPGGSYPVNPFFADFKVFQDGKAVDYKKYFHGFNPDAKEIDYDEVFSIDAYIKANEKTSIRVLYSFMIFTYDPALIPGIQYILKSARNFPEPIKKAAINLRIHFPVSDLESESYPDTRSIVFNKQQSPYCICSWEFIDFVPSEDISVFIGTTGIDKNFSNIESLLNALNNHKALYAYFSLAWLYHYKGLSLPLDINQVIGEVLREFYNHALLDNSVSPLIKGFIIRDIERHSILSPEKKIVKYAESWIKSQAENSFQIERSKIKSILALYKNTPLDRRMIISLSKFIETKNSYKYFASAAKDNNPFVDTIRQLAEETEFVNMTNEIKSLVDNAYTSVLTSLLEEKNDNRAAIKQFEQSMYKIPINPVTYDKNNIESLIKELWNKTIGMDKEARKLSKILSLSINRGFYMFEDNKSLIQVKDLRRKAYYTLGNYYYHSDPDKAVYHYKLAFSFCRTSPLWDFLSLYVDPFGSTWFDWIDNTEEDRNDREVAVIYCQKWELDFMPWWKHLPDPKPSPEHIEEQEIVDLYSAKRIMECDLSKWEIEDSHTAPCYFIAYNTGCVYAKKGQPLKALDWLHIAWRLNKKEIKKYIWNDNDLKDLREKFPDSFNNYFIN